MTALSVIGIGSPHAADQLGWQVIDMLRQNPAIQDLGSTRLSLHRCDRPGLSLLEYLKGVECAILVDAVEGGTAGRHVRLTREQLVVDPARLSSHAAGVAEALALGDSLQLLPSRLVLHGMEIGSAGIDFIPAETNLQQLAGAIAAEVAHCCQEPDNLKNAPGTVTKTNTQ
jgi:hydrogenase maturation protease